VTQVLEAVNVAILMEKKADCWFCKAQPNSEAVNHVHDEENPLSGGAGDAVPENDIANNSSTLGGNLGTRPNWAVQIEQQPKSVTPAAHHLIPGNASYKNATELHKYVSKKEGIISGDIGYNINAEENGVWLPGNYAVRPWGTYTHQNDYAVASMKAAAAQFHDAHPDYSTNVKNTLLSMAEKLDKARETMKQPDKCPLCGSDMADKGKLRPPYGLVGKLHTVSSNHRRILLGRGLREKFINAGYYTSSRVRLLFPSSSP